MAVKMSKLTEDMLPSERVQELCRAYGRGQHTRLMIETLGVGHLNRAISWKYVHSRLRTIMDVDGFSSERYKYAIAVEPQSSDTLASTRRTQEEVAEAMGKLAKVDNQPKYGLLTKNHLLLGLLVLKDGRIAKDHDQESLWTTPVKDGSQRHRELHEVLEKGLYVLLLDKSIWECESLDDIKLIIDGDNLDQASCMADHEIHMFQRMRSKTAEHEQKRKEASSNGVKVANLRTLFDDVYADVQAVAGSFCKEDCTSIYNLAHNLPDSYGDFLVRFHFMYVNPTALKVKPEIFGFIATFGDKLPYVKICMMLACYMAPKE